MLADLFIGTGIGYKFLPGRISRCAINFMRPEITNSWRAAKSHHINKLYRHVTGIDNLLVYSAKLTHAVVNFMF
ncbi:hypothetical protein [uncultured Campylobacter sp.]|uniref:hypothetical protein n=1 Tax=uncultured Campylobacter sp. TaxID=218934 RepID=UPI0026277B02|nr:hypothetical protein [uncultured Campylobacter sp.]